MQQYAELKRQNPATGKSQLQEEFEVFLTFCEQMWALISCLLAEESS